MSNTSYRMSANSHPEAKSTALDRAFISDKEAQNASERGIVTRLGVHSRRPVPEVPSRTIYSVNIRSLRLGSCQATIRTVVRTS